MNVKEREREREADASFGLTCGAAVAPAGTREWGRTRTKWCESRVAGVANADVRRAGVSRIDQARCERPLGLAPRPRPTSDWFGIWEYQVSAIGVCSVWNRKVRGRPDGDYCVLLQGAARGWAERRRLARQAVGGVRTPRCSNEAHKARRSTASPGRLLGALSPAKVGDGGVKRREDVLPDVVHGLERVEQHVRRRRARGLQP